MTESPCTCLKWRRSIPCGRVKRRAMTRDGGRNVLGEVGIDGCRRVLGKQCDALRNRAANRLAGMKDGNWPSAIFDDDFRTGAHAGQQSRNACRRGFRFRDSDYMLGHETIIRLAPGKRQSLVLHLSFSPLVTRHFLISLFLLSAF